MGVCHGVSWILRSLSSSESVPLSFFFIFLLSFFLSFCSYYGEPGVGSLIRYFRSLSVRETGRKLVCVWACGSVCWALVCFVL
eukprot:m.91015 g.91015  ORF g.91015 m.91015 type:complete len:83 (+) comp51116_c0_seq1:1182-1430(+)